MLVGGKTSELNAQMKRKETFNQKQLDGAGGLVEVPTVLPIWVEPRAENGTPMESAFDLAAQLVEAWVREKPDNFPPVVINITDGHPNYPDRAVQSAQTLAGLGTSDGRVLMLNAHIDESGGAEIKLPADDSKLRNDFAKLLFEISSPLPAPMIAAAQNAGFEPRNGARGFVMNANAETLTKLIVFGSAHAR